VRESLDVGEVEGERASIELDPSERACLSPIAYPPLRAPEPLRNLSDVEEVPLLSRIRRRRRRSTLELGGDPWRESIGENYDEFVD
jgi:hypothetical protein